MAEIPADVQAWIGQKRYELWGDFDVERGYVFTSCSSVMNGNPLFWDEKAAQEITGGFVAPPTMISVWFRPHNWSPGRDEGAVPLQCHFDLKARLNVPEAVMTDNAITFYEPVRIGDRLKTHQVITSISPLKETKLGIGHFWGLEVHYENQRGERVAIETYTGYGYRRKK